MPNIIHIGKTKTFQDEMIIEFPDCAFELNRIYYAIPDDTPRNTPLLIVIPKGGYYEGRPVLISNRHRLDRAYKICLWARSLKPGSSIFSTIYTDDELSRKRLLPYYHYNYAYPPNNAPTNASRA